ncbi:hypothetical protein AVEN_191117-1 [Araneus ventricosus]|uniref:Pre-C2HC domain-containing protein n=1 Tax=Araneus ventricosus TaxID=182803 RepID=A0A4Y2AXR9_ARAVE|nr:hypothetical protein AVEN_191117-1 [Araneus ventricosus]
MEEASRSSSFEHSTCSTPRSWDSRVSMEMLRERDICKELTELDSNWKQLDSRLSSIIECMDNLQKLGRKNTPEYTKLSSDAKKLQDRIDVIENALDRIGECPFRYCSKHGNCPEFKKDTPEITTGASLPENMDTDKQVRNTSPTEKDFEIVSPRKAAKIRKPKEKPEISTDNKFKELMEIDNDNDNAKTEETKIQIPEINLKIDANYNLTLQEINRMYPDTQNKLVKGFISIQATSNDNRNNIIEYLKKNDKEFILLEAYSNRPLKVVIKGLPVEQNKDELKQILENLNFQIVRINQLKNYQLKTYHPIFLIEVAKTNNY